MPATFPPRRQRATMASRSPATERRSAEGARCSGSTACVTLGSPLRQGPRMTVVRFFLAGLLAAWAPAAASAQEMSPSLKELAAAANRDGVLTLSWSQTTLGGSQGAARLQA